MMNLFKSRSIADRRALEAHLKSRTFRLANKVVPRGKDRGHFGLVGTTGSGKSTLLKILIQSILGHPDDDLDATNAFVFDPQNDLYRAIMGMGLPFEVILTNPLDSRAWAWDMAKDIRDPVGAAQFARTALGNDETGGENRFYSEAPKIIFAAVLRELINRNIPWTLRLAYLVTLDDKYAEQLIRTSGDPGVRVVSRLFDEQQGTTRANVSSSLLTRLAHLETYAALMEHARNKYSIGDLIRGDVVAVCGGDLEYNHIIQPMSYLFLATLKQKLLGRAESNRRRSYIFVDEFSALNGRAPADEILDVFERGRSRGVRIGIVIHSPEQLVSVYGRERAATILGLVQHKVILKVDEKEGSEWASALLPQVHGYEWTRNYSESAAFSSQGVTSTYGSGASETFANRPIVTPDQIRNLRMASLTHGIDGFGIMPGNYGVDRWKFHLSPGWLAEHLVIGDDSVASYESCRRDGRQQRLAPLTRAEVEAIGLAFHQSPPKP